MECYIAHKTGAEWMLWGTIQPFLCADWSGLLLGAADEVRLPDNGPTGGFNAAIGEAGMKQGALFDAYLVFVQNGINGTDAAKIIVFFLENEVDVDNFGHILAIWKFLLQRYSI